MNNNIIKFKTIILLIIGISTIAASTFIFLTIIKFRNIPFNWDPAARACEGLIIANDLKAGDIISFFADTYRQGWWPFFHSWLLAPAFILFGNTYVAARSVSLFCFILFIPTIYLISIEMSEKRGHWMGLIITYLTLTVWPFLSNAAICMAEIPGLLMTFITLLFYLKAIKHQKSYLFAFTSILMAFTLFTKWHHGIFVIFAVSFTQLTNNKKFLSHTNYSLFIPFLVLMTGWFIYPQHILSFYGHSTFQPHFFKFFSIDNWLFYPNSFFCVYHRSPFVAAVIGISFIYSLKKIKDPKIRLFATHFLIGIILLTIKLDNRHRYIITIVPSVWILGSYQLVEFIYNIKDRLNNKYLEIVMVSIIIVGFSISYYKPVKNLYEKYPDGLLKIKYWGDEKPGKAYKFISENTGNHNHIAVFGTWDYYNSLRGATIRWHLEVSRDNDFQNKIARKEKTYSYFYEILKNRDKKSYQNFINFLKNKDITVHEYHLLSFMKMINAPVYRDYRKGININPFSDKIVDVNSIDNRITCLITISKEEEKEINHFSEQFLSNQNKWIEYASKIFPDLGITITLYKKKATRITT
jgi:hypothetical protein